MNTGFPDGSQVCVHGFRARGLRPRPGMTNYRRFLHTLEGRGPQAMHVVSQNDPGSDPKGRPEACPADRLAQGVDTRHQQIGAAIEQIQSKKGRSRLELDCDDTPA
jgi:hypothetical protein